MKENEIIMYDSPEAATFLTNIQGWVDKDRKFFGGGAEGENMARYSSCTHKICKCGNRMDKFYLQCDKCRHKAAVERYNALPFKEWDGNEPVCTWDGDRYFFSEEDVIDYMDDNEMESIDLLICDGNNWQKVNSDYWEDQMPENSEGELPKELQTALNELNRVLSTLPPQSYSPGKIRTSYTYTSPTSTIK